MFRLIFGRKIEKLLRLYLDAERVMKEKQSESETGDTVFVEE